MACMGPSKDFAIECSHEAYTEIMNLLREKYHIQRPFDSPMATGFTARMQKEWDEQEEQLKKALEELFWTDHAASF